MMKNTRITLAFLILFASAVSIANAMDLVVILPGEQALTVNAESENTVAQLKSKIYAASDLSPLNQIVFKGKQRLESDRTLGSYNIVNGDTLLVKHGILNAPTQKEKGNGIWIFLTMAAIVGIGVFFMRKKPNREFDGK